MRRRANAVVVALALALGVATARADAASSTVESPASVVQKSMAAVARGAFDDAIDDLELLADRGFVHPDASYARAYAYVERARSRAKHPGDLGRAVAALEEVHLLRPESKVDEPLATLRSEISRLRAREGSSPVLQRPALGRAVATLLPENVWAGSALAGSLLVSVGLALYLFVKQRWAEIAGATSLVAGLVFGTLGAGLTLAARAYRTHSRPAVVVVADARLLDESGHTVVRSARETSSVPEGSLVYVHDERSGLSRIEWGTLEGWVEASDLRKLASAE